MIAFGYFLQAIAGVLRLTLNLFYVLLIARCILSFVSPDPRNPLVQFIYNTTEPLLVRVRERIPPVGMFDLSAMIVLLLLYFLDVFLVNSIEAYGHHFLTVSLQP